MIKFQLNLPLKQEDFFIIMRSNYISYRLRKIIERINVRKFAGFQLTSAFLLAGVIFPQLQIVSSAVVSQQFNQNLPISDNLTEKTFIWPLENYQISQNFRFYHPAIDLSAKTGTPVLAIGNGTVEKVSNTNWGYGHHIIIRHENGYFSLYAHLEKIFVKNQDKITQGLPIGTVGLSGWTSGPHLHLEIRGPEDFINPLEVLPSQNP